jgi:hypothetical protein
MLISDFQTNFPSQHSVLSTSFLTGIGVIDFGTGKRLEPIIQQITFPQFTRLKVNFSTQYKSARQLKSPRFVYTKRGILTEESMITRSDGDRIE